MGVGSSKEVVFVDDDPSEIKRSVGFSPDIFKGREFATLKAFCNKRDVHQRHLNAVWKRYMSTDEVYVRDFRVRTLDTKDAFMSKSKIFQEISEIFIPTIFMKDFSGLQEGHSMEEVSFPRFVIMSYIFCAQPIPDLIFDFIAILRQRFNLQLSAILFAFNFEQMVHVLAEELKPSASKKYLLQLCQKFRKDEELSVGAIITMAIKYPLLFYQLKRFRAHFRRLFLGDKFWAERSKLKTKLGELGLRKGFDGDFATEAAATRATARCLLRDVLFHAEHEYEMKLTDAIEVPLKEISDTACTLLKKTLGFQLARSLILESELPFPPQEFLSDCTTIPGSPGGQEQRITDHLSKEEFLYDVSTGKSAWLLKYLSSDGLDEVLKETQHARVSHLAFEQATTDNGTEFDD